MSARTCVSVAKKGGGGHTEIWRWLVVLLALTLMTWPRHPATAAAAEAGAEAGAGAGRGVGGDSGYSAAAGRRPLELVVQPVMTVVVVMEPPPLVVVVT